MGKVLKIREIGDSVLKNISEELLIVMIFLMDIVMVMILMII